MAATSVHSRPADAVEALRHRVESALGSVVDAEEPRGLYDPVRYVLQSGGKRLRPVLLLLAARIFDVDTEDALPAALAVEIFHNFTLVHDDIMDHADERRGRPTVHVRWDESTAILCGDYLMALAYQQLASSRRGDPSALITRFHQTVARLCEGQTLDKEFETRSEVSVDEYLDMVDRKTGALLQCALELGGMLGDAEERHLHMLATVGARVGRAFQIMDDLLDLTARDDRWGKTIGGDLIEGKKTYLLLRAIERAGADDREWLLRIVHENGIAPEEVDEARERMRRSGVLEEARQEVLRYSDAALDSASGLPESEAADTLRWLLKRMRERLH